MRVYKCMDCGERLRPPEEAGYLACVKCFARETCAAQGIEVKVTDEATLRNVAVLLGADPGRWVSL